MSAPVPDPQFSEQHSRDSASGDHSAQDDPFSEERLFANDPAWQDDSSNGDGLVALGRILPQHSRRRVLALGLYRRVLPEESRRRRWFRDVMVVFWEIRNAAIRTREQWRLTQEEWMRARELKRTGNDPSGKAQLLFHQWSFRIPPNQETLTAQKCLFDERIHPRPVHALIVDCGEGDEATTASLQDQTWGLVEVVRVGSEQLAGEFSRLAQDHSDDLVVILRAGDRLRSDALYEMSQVIWRDPLVQIVYWDDDLAEVAEVWDWASAGMPPDVYTTRELGQVGDPRIKPGWSPDLLTCVNYIGRAFAIRARHLDPETAIRCQASALDDDSLWWDLLLSVGVDREQVHHLSTVMQTLKGERDRVATRHLELVDRWFDRHSWPAKAQLGPDGIVPEWASTRLPPVSVIIPTRHNRRLVADALALIRGAEYPDVQVIIVDNGGRSARNEAWYAKTAADLDPEIIWWDEPFNYSAVNNRAAAMATGEILVFLNDDTALGDAGWLAHICGWAHRPEIGVVGLQLIDDDNLIQHGGVVVGMHGFADHLFQGMAPHSDSLMGSTDWTRNALATTGACLAVRRSVFEEIGGFDEGLVLCGSDVVLGVRAWQAGYRNVVSAATPIRHRESATRGRFVPENDVFASYWSYERWLKGGDPFFSASLSVDFPEPALRLVNELDVLERLTRILERPMEASPQRSESSEAHSMALAATSDRELADMVDRGHRSIRGHHPVHTINWFVPQFQNPFYEGIHTVFRLAEHLAVNHGVENRFVVMTSSVDNDERWFRSGMKAAFPALGDSLVAHHNYFDFNPDKVSPADVAMATAWTTTYAVARAPEQARRFYLIQDYEPMFHPSGTLHALAEHSYRLGLYGLCNTGHLADLYSSRYGGVADHFWPGVDNQVFHNQGRVDPNPELPVTVFLNARPDDTRNCWELASRAMHLVKMRLGDKVRIITAGSWTPPDNAHNDLMHLGRLDYHETGTLYRTCDIGIALSVSEHPSYLPLELMACGATVVAFDNPAGDWLLRDDHNCVRTPQTADGLASEIVALALDPARRQRLAKQGREDLVARHARWDENLAGVYRYLCDPESKR